MSSTSLQGKECTNSANAAALHGRAMTGIYVSLAHRHSAVGPDLIGRLNEREVEVVREVLRRRFRHDGAWTAEEGALLLVAGAIAMREDGARASWDTIAAWLGIERPGPGPEQRAREAMAEAEGLYGKRLSRGIDRRCLYIGTMFRDSGQLWRLLLQVLDRLGNRDAFWRAARGWTEEDWAKEVRRHVDVRDAEARDALAERLAELCEGRGLLQELQLVAATFEGTWAGLHGAGVDPRETLGVQNDDEARVLLPRLFRFRSERAASTSGGAAEAHDDVVQWVVARCSDGRLRVGVRLAGRLPLDALPVAQTEARVAHPERPRWNEFGERSDIVAEYRREEDGWVLQGASDWIDVPVEGLRIAARRNERAFPLPEFPPLGMLVRDDPGGEVLPVLASPRLGELCVLVTAPDTEVEGLGATPEVLPGGWIARRFRAGAGLAYTVSARGISEDVACGRAPVGCPLRIDGRTVLDEPRGRFLVGGRAVFVGMPRVTARTIGARRTEPVVRHLGPEGEQRVPVSWERGVLRVEGSGPGAWTIEEPEGRWRARFHVLASDQLPRVEWAGAGVRVSLAREAAWSWNGRVVRGPVAEVALPTEDAGPTAVTATTAGEPEYRWSLRGRAAGIALLDAAGNVRDATCLPRSELVRGDLLRCRGPAGARVLVRARGEEHEVCTLSTEGERTMRASPLFRAVDDGVGDLDVRLVIDGTDVAARFTLFDDGASARPVGTPKHIELTTDVEGVRRLRLDVDGAEFERARVGVVRLAAEVPWVGWDELRWQNGWRTGAYASLPPGPYGVLVRGERRLPDGDIAPNARTMAARLDVPGPREARQPTHGLAKRLRAQDTDGLDLWAPRRRLAEVRGELRQLAEVAEALDGPSRPELVRAIVALPAAAPRLAWWVLRARAGLDHDPAIDEPVLAALEGLLRDGGWHPSWIRYAALPLLLPPWPSGGYPAWVEGAREAAARIAAIHPNLTVPMESLLQQEVAIGLVKADGHWPRHRAMEPPTVPPGRTVAVDIPPEWERRVRGLVADRYKDPKLSFATETFRAVERAAQVGADVLVARRVLLEAIFLREVRACPAREDLDRHADLVRWTDHVQVDPDLLARTRAWERALLRRFPLTCFAS